MKAPKSISTSRKLIHEIQLARLRLVKLENQWKSAREHARLAKRRRKEAKEAARRARKQAKLAKREVAEAKQVLAKAEKKLARIAKSAAKIKTRQPPAAKAAIAARGKKMAHRRVTRSAASLASPATKSVKPPRPTPAPAKDPSDLKPTVEGKRESATVPRDIESPLSSASPTPSETVT